MAIISEHNRHVFGNVSGEVLLFC